MNPRGVWLTSGCRILIVAVTTTIASAQTAKTIAKRAFAATVIVTTTDAQGQMRSQGSGFFVGPGRVGTALHLLEGAAKGEVGLVGDDLRLPITGVIAVDGGA